MHTPSLDSTQKPTILVLHGVTMSGRSMLALLGPIADSLRAAGFELVAPDAAGRMSKEQVAGLVSWARSTYAKVGQDADAAFCEGVFWQGGEHGDWFDAVTDPASGEKTYRALAPSLERVRAATSGRRVVGVLGFSQGCAMAAVVSGAAKRGALPFGDTLRFGVYVAGFKPAFARPEIELWPVPDVAGLFAAGTADAIFSDPEGIRALAREFTDPEVHIVEGLQHTMPVSAEWVERITAFATRHG